MSFSECSIRVSSVQICTRSSQLLFMCWTEVTLRERKYWEGHFIVCFAASCVSTNGFWNFNLAVACSQALTMGKLCVCILLGFMSLSYCSKLYCLLKARLGCMLYIIILIENHCNFSIQICWCRPVMPWNGVLLVIFIVVGRWWRISAKQKVNKRGI